MEKNFLKNVLDKIDTRICITDGRGIVIYCNIAFCESFGGGKELAGMSHDELAESYRAISVYKECLAKGAKVTTELATATPVIDDNGIFQYCVEEIYIGKEHQTKDEHMSPSPSGPEDLVLGDKAMIEIKDTISKIAYLDSTILIQGETGTGKTELARYIHKNSNRSNKPFVTINCGAIPENLIESELFGYASGAFTGASKRGKPGHLEMADGGTLFLDEIGLLPYNLQSKFLQLIQEKTYTPVGGLKSKTVDIKIISATNENLNQFVKERKFREDLYYRLRVIEIFVPPLRERVDAIEMLVKHFVNKYNMKFGKSKTITSAAVSALKSYSWPGNIRELQYVLERVMVTSANDIITSEDIPPIKDMAYDSSTEAEPIVISEMEDFDGAVSMLEKELLIKAYKKYASSYKVATALGISQTKASRLLRKYGIS